MITIEIVFTMNLCTSRHVKLGSRAVSRLVWGLFFYAMTILLCSVRIRAYTISTSKPTQLRTRNAVLSENCVWKFFSAKNTQVFCVSATSEIVSLITDFRTDCNISCTNFFDRKYKKNISKAAWLVYYWLCSWNGLQMLYFYIHLKTWPIISPP